VEAPDRRTHETERAARGVPAHGGREGVRGFPRLPTATAARIAAASASEVTAIRPESLENESELQLGPHGPAGRVVAFPNGVARSEGYVEPAWTQSTTEKQYVLDARRPERSNSSVAPTLKRSSNTQSAGPR
jgi:hypothetical protein